MGKKSPFKSKQSLKPGEVRKNVDLPKGDLAVLVGLAKAERIQVKPYMERILIGHAKDNKDFVSVDEYVKSNGK